MSDMTLWNILIVVVAAISIVNSIVRIWKRAKRKEAEESDIDYASRYYFVLIVLAIWIIVNRVGALQEDLSGMPE